MSDKPDRPLPPLSSEPLPSDPLLERLLGGIAKGLDGLVRGMDALVQGNHELRQAFGELRTEITKSDRRTESRVSDLQVAIDTFVLRVEAAVEHQKTVAGLTTDARRALDAGTKELQRAVDNTDRFLTLQQEEEGAAPKLAHRALNFVWPAAMRHGKGAIGWAIKLAAGSASLGALAKLIHAALTGHVQ